MEGFGTVRLGKLDPPEGRLEPEGALRAPEKPLLREPEDQLRPPEKPLLREPEE